MTEERTIEDAVERIEDEHSSLTLDWLLPSSVLQAIRIELEAAEQRGRLAGLRDLVAAQGLSDMRPGERERAWLAEAEKANNAGSPDGTAS